MGLRSYKITRGSLKGERGYRKPPTLDPATTSGRLKMVKCHVDFVSFYADNYYVCDGHVTSRRGPLSKYNIPVGTVYQVWPRIFDRIEIEKLRTGGKKKKR